MTQLFAVVLGKDRERVTETILREGVMQFITISNLDEKESVDFAAVEPEKNLTDIIDLRKRVEGILHTVGIIPAAPRETDLKNRVTVDIAKESDFLDTIDRKRESIRERQRTIQQEILKLEDIKRQMVIYGVGLSNVTMPAKNSLLTMQTGKLPATKDKQLEDDLKNLPALKITLAQENNETHLLLISMKRDREQIKQKLTQAEWTPVNIPREESSFKKDLLNEVTEKLKKITAEQKNIQQQVDGLVKKQEKQLRELWRNLRINELCCKIQVHFKSSSRTTLFAGWIPSAKKEALKKKINETCKGRCYLEWYEPGGKDVIGDDIPVQFNNPTMFAPFQMLVSNFAIPQYGTIDPTPFVMPIYLAMFGLMFADAGQGLVLIVIGILGASMLKKNKEKKGLFHISWLIFWCGISSIVFGILFGSYFGAGFVKPLWFDFHGIVSGHSPEHSMIGNIYDILLITIYFGISVIFMGLAFNWINIILARNWMELFFDKGGILGAWIYAGGIYITSYLIKYNYKELPPGTTLFFLAGLPCLLLFIKGPCHYFAHRKSQPEQNNSVLFAILNFFMEWIVELLEIFSGYLSNTLSFMRVAGLGIAHVCLMISFFTIADMTSGVFSILVLILGNILVIALEGLSAGIQALRLNYYEFFTKFFHGTGKLHTPISLQSKL